MMNFEEIEHLLYTDTERRQPMHEHRRLRLSATGVTRNSGVKVTERSSDSTRMTTFPAGIERRFDSGQFASRQIIEVALD
jgi:hypothetical protein